ncbi:MAG: flagellar hook-basal body complex protein FliE [Sphingomonadales bacterium]|nr:flagellar hook-basal body complex protein FliE [Sphingomonadales bacterium]
MTGIEAIGAIGLGAGDAAISRLSLTAPVAPAQIGQAGFSDILASGIRQVEGKVATANEMVQRFALDDSVPLHQVTFALEEARMSVELAMQVRTRLVESYRELMNMQI